MNRLNRASVSRSLRAVALAMGLTAGLSAQAQIRFTYSADGSEVTDAQTGLTWRRCSAGQTWSAGTCSGGLSVYTHEAALVYAASQSGWRLPNVKELRSLVDTSRVVPAIDTVAFPGTASMTYWSSTPNIQLSSSAWSVEFNLGAVSSTARNTVVVMVRLVR